MYNYIQRQVVCVMGELGPLTTGNFSIGMCFGESYRKHFVKTVCNVDFYYNNGFASCSKPMDIPFFDLG